MQNLKLDIRTIVREQLLLGGLVVVGLLCPIIISYLLPYVKAIWPDMALIHV